MSEKPNTTSDLVIHLKQHVQREHPEWGWVSDAPAWFHQRTHRTEGHKHAWFGFFIKEGAEWIGSEILGSIQDMTQDEEQNRRIAEQQFRIYEWQDSIILDLYFTARTTRKATSTESPVSVRT